MRPKERINNFLKKVDWDKLYKEWDVENSKPGDWKGFEQYFLEYWNENPDQRIGQVLVNLGILPDRVSIYYAEESDILMSQGYTPEECIFWTSIYDENKNLMSSPKSNLICDLSIDHIENILSYMARNNQNIEDSLSRAFKNVLKQKSA